MTKGPIEPDLVKKVAMAIWEASGFSVAWHNVHPESEQHKGRVIMARAAIAVVLHYIMEEYPERGPVMADTIARENGIEL